MRVAPINANMGRLQLLLLAPKIMTINETRTSENAIIKGYVLNIAEGGIKNKDSSNSFLLWLLKKLFPELRV